jgi:hypothetical protein
MRFHIPCTALGLALVAAAPAAHAQTVITREIVIRPVATVVAQQPLVTLPDGTVVQPTVVQPMQTVQPVQTVQTTETVRTMRPAQRVVRRQVVTTRTITRQRIVPAPSLVARSVTMAPQPLYDVVAPAPFATGLDDDYSTPALYDTVAPVAVPPAVAIPPLQGAYTTPFIYRYVYEPDRILVIDPNTGIAVQAIPR